MKNNHKFQNKILKYTLQKNNNINMNTNTSHNAQYSLPKYIHLLSEADKIGYQFLRNKLSLSIAKIQRNKRIESFADLIDSIKQYCIRGDANDWRRCLVCGICWLGDSIAINTHQLKMLIFKCKSSINGSLHKMGYSANVNRNIAISMLLYYFPMLQNSINDLRAWTVRQYISRPDKYIENTFGTAYGKENLTENTRIKKEAPSISPPPNQTRPRSRNVFEIPMFGKSSKPAKDNTEADEKHVNKECLEYCSNFNEDDKGNEILCNDGFDLCYEIDFEGYF